MIILIVSFIFGMIIASYTLLSAVICLVFCIPLTVELERENMIAKNHPIISKYLGSILILFVIFFGITFSIFKFGSPAVQIGYTLGFVYVFFKIIFNKSQIGINQGNVSDYIKTASNVKHFKKVSPARGTPTDDVLNFIYIKVFFNQLDIIASKMARRENLATQVEIKTRATEIFKDAANIEPETHEGKLARMESQKHAQHVTQLNKI